MMRLRGPLGYFKSDMIGVGLDGLVNGWVFRRLFVSFVVGACLFDFVCWSGFLFKWGSLCRLYSLLLFYGLSGLVLGLWA